jgi:threonine/homoserine/homoserine lactone efflux protein
MLASIFFRGFVLGFSIAAPVGPIGVLCINRTLTRGALIGFASGLGAACADAIYGALAVSGISAINNLLASATVILRVVGGAYLLWLAYSIWMTPPQNKESTASVTESTIAGAFASTFGLTLTNPITILSFAAIVSAIGINAGKETSSALLLIAGVFVGSALWWLILSGGTGMVAKKLSGQLIAYINRISACIIACVAGWAMIGLFIR